MTTLWLVWIAAFFAIEGYAIFKHVKGGTLSEHFYKWFSLKNHGAMYWVRRGILMLAFLWVGWHFFA